MSKSVHPIFLVTHQLSLAVDGQREVHSATIHFDREVGLNEVCLTIEKLYYRPATKEELSAYAGKLSGMGERGQTKILGLGTRRPHYNGFWFPCLVGIEERRGLAEHRWDRSTGPEFGAGTRFLIVHD